MFNFIITYLLGAQRTMGFFHEKKPFFVILKATVIITPFLDG